MPKLRVQTIKKRVTSYSEKLFPNKYNKKQVIYDNFSKMYLSDTNLKNMDKRIVIDRAQCNIVMADTFNRKTSEISISIS